VPRGSRARRSRVRSRTKARADGIVGDSLGDDVARAGQRRLLDVGDAASGSA
jgi:hypothetical protein